MSSATNEPVRRGAAPWARLKFAPMECLSEVEGLCDSDAAARTDDLQAALDPGRVGTGIPLRGGLGRRRGADRPPGNSPDERSPGCPHRAPRGHGPTILADLGADRARPEGW